MKSDREQEFETIKAKEDWRMAELMKEASLNGYSVVGGILRVDGEYVAFLQRDKPASEEVL